MGKWARHRSLLVEEAGMVGVYSPQDKVAARTWATSTEGRLAQAHSLDKVGAMAGQEVPLAVLVVDFVVQIPK